MSIAFDRRLLRLALLTTILLGLVVVAGSVVRATGSGMGCPDWPKCFGHWIPPTNVSELPPNYQALYPGQEIAPFNAFKTWTEYTNRLFGAASGFALLATMVASFFAWRRDRATPLLLVSVMLLAAIVIWLGKVVVDKNLHPRQVTIHMLGGLLLVMGSVVASCRIWKRVKLQSPIALTVKMRQALWLSLGLVVGQILLGTQMREQVDTLLANGSCCDGRASLEPLLGQTYLAHRLLAALTVFSVVWLFFGLRFSTARPFPVFNLFLGASVGASYGVGVLLVRLNLPAYLQPAHLVLATITLGILVAMATMSRRAGPTHG
jgi:cytochrome c oxidase assembly protein subunit 15